MPGLGWWHIPSQEAEAGRSLRDLVYTNSRLSKPTLLNPVSDDDVDYSKLTTDHV